MQKKILVCVLLAAAILLPGQGGVCAQKTACNLEPMFENLDLWLFGEYSPGFYKQLKELYYSLTPEQKSCLIQYVKDKFPKEKSFYVVMWFSLFKDKELLPFIKKTYLKQKADDVRAQCEIYFVCVNYKKQENIRRFVARLEAKSGLEEVLYMAVPAQEKEITDAMLRYAKNGKMGHYTAAERWFGVMSWLERNEKWLLNDGDVYLNERLELLK